VLTFLRTSTARDFTYYKRATILRRIGRRMQVNGVEDLRAYLNCLRTRPGEPAALLQDLLISVTNFFRDAECFRALEAVLPRLFEGKTAGDLLRVWVAGCATGEEAYSVAILLNEHARQMESPPTLQVFATDLDDQAIQTARDGCYPTVIEADVSEERLRRYFIREHRGYRLRREVRETVLFATHDLLKDSPFSRLDLITCRNLMIYLDRDAQSRLFSIFHFALRPDGYLFLGSSESAEDASALFTVIDKKHRLYRQRPAPRNGSRALRGLLPVNEFLKKHGPAELAVPRPLSAPRILLTRACLQIGVDLFLTGLVFGRGRNMVGDGDEVEIGFARTLVHVGQNIGCLDPSLGFREFLCAAINACQVIGIVAEMSVIDGDLRDLPIIAAFDRIILSRRWNRERHHSRAERGQ